MNAVMHIRLAMMAHSRAARLPRQIAHQAQAETKPKISEKTGAITKLCKGDSFIRLTA